MNFNKFQAINLRNLPINLTTYRGYAEPIWLSNKTLKLLAKHSIYELINSFFSKSVNFLLLDKISKWFEWNLCKNSFCTSSINFCLHFLCYFMPPILSQTFVRETLHKMDLLIIVSCIAALSCLIFCFQKFKYPRS